MKFTKIKSLEFRIGVILLKKRLLANCLVNHMNINFVYIFMVSIYRTVKKCLNLCNVANLLLLKYVLQKYINLKCASHPLYICYSTPSIH